jgi:hypothetical protein
LLSQANFSQPLNNNNFHQQIFHSHTTTTTTTLTKPKGIEISETSTKQEMEEQHSDAQVQWIKSKDNAQEYHRTYIEDLLAKISEDRNISYEAAQKQLYHQELSKASHARQKRFLKPFSKGIADHVRIAQPNSEDPNAYIDMHEGTTPTKCMQTNRSKYIALFKRTSSRHDT